MEHLTFILWVILWPLSIEIGEYVTVKRKKIIGEKLTRGNETAEIILLFSIWIIVAIMVY